MPRRMQLDEAFPSGMSVRFFQEFLALDIDPLCAFELFIFEGPFVCAVELRSLQSRDSVGKCFFLVSAQCRLVLVNVC